MYKILFVEDDDSIGFIVSRYTLWNESDFTITQMATNGQQAADWLLKEKFDLVITDIRMPVINGLELIKLIRDRGDDTCVILASNYSDFKYAKEGIRLGALDYIEKPFSQEKLKEALNLAQQYLSKKSNQNDLVLALHTYAPENKIKQWVQYIIDTNAKVIAEVDQLNQKWKEIFISEPQKVTVMFQGLIKELWKHLSDIYPWLAYLVGQPFSEIEQQPTIELVAVMNQFLEISHKYELCKLDGTINKVCVLVTQGIHQYNISDWVSEQLGLSKEYISKQLKIKIGMTLNEFITMVKLEQAKNLLMHSNQKVYEISEALGYSTVDYFTKLFKQYTGVTPAKFKKDLGLIR